ncbi:histidinol-phosphate transaminase [bacterium]|nr:histidinol-phosphate transaminase [bacterium]
MKTNFDLILRKNIKKLKSYSTEKVDCKVKLDANENPFDFPMQLKEIILKDLFKHLFNRYPDPDASLLKELLAEEIKVDEDKITLGNGSDELIQSLTLAFGSKSSLVFYPSFSMYRIISTVCNIKTRVISLDKKFDIDIDTTLRYIKKNQPSLIFIGYPNNPTGNSFSKDKIVNIIQSSSGLIVMDEAYSEFSNKSFLPLINKYDNLVILRTFSKAYGLAGCRIGYMIGSEKVVEQVNKVKLPFNLNSISQRIGIIALKHKKKCNKAIKIIISERARLLRKMQKISAIYTFPTEANFILFRPKVSSKTVFKKLLSNGILIRDVADNKLLKNCLRVTVGKPSENDAFLHVIEKLK